MVLPCASMANDDVSRASGPSDLPLEPTVVASLTDRVLFLNVTGVRNFSQGSYLSKFALLIPSTEEKKNLRTFNINFAKIIPVVSGDQRIMISLQELEMTKCLWVCGPWKHEFLTSESVHHVCLPIDFTTQNRGRKIIIRALTCLAYCLQC